MRFRLRKASGLGRMAWLAHGLAEAPPTKLRLQTWTRHLIAFAQRGSFHSAHLTPFAIPGMR